MSFVFTLAPGSTMISGVRANPDGTRSALPGSPFAAPEPARQLLALGGNLLFQGQNGLALFSVDRESGQLRQIDQIALPGISSAVVRPSDQTVVLLNADEVSLYRVMDNRLVLLPGAPQPLPPEAAERNLKPASMVLDSSGNPYLSFTVPGGGAATVFAEASVGADGTIRQLSLTESLPDEVAKAFAAQSSSAAARPRLAAVITP